MLGHVSRGDPISMPLGAMEKKVEARDQVHTLITGLIRVAPPARFELAPLSPEGELNSDAGERIPVLISASES